MTKDRLGPINRLLDRAKEVTGSDLETARRLGYEHASFVYRMRRGDRSIPVEIATRLAHLLGRPPLQVICEIEAAQAESEESRRYWNSLRKNTAAAVVSGNTMTEFAGVVGRVGIEPTTSGSKVRCSTD